LENVRSKCTYEASTKKAEGVRWPCVVFLVCQPSTPVSPALVQDSSASVSGGDGGETKRQQQLDRLFPRSKAMAEQLKSSSAIPLFSVDSRLISFRLVPSPLRGFPWSCNILPGLGFSVGLLCGCCFGSCLAVGTPERWAVLRILLAPPVEGEKKEATMRRVRVSSHSPVHRLGDSQLASSPRFRFAVATKRPPLSSDDPVPPEQEPPAGVDQLIPGLPDDIALNCLLRLPVASLPCCSFVCRRWRLLLANKERFFSERRGLGLSSSWLFVLAFDRCTEKIQWRVLDLTLFCWHTIPAMPCRDRVCPHGLRSVAIPEEGALLVCGGSLPGVDCPLDTVLRYEMQRDLWTAMSRMHTPRSFFAGGLIDGLVYAAGGNSTNLSELSSAEALDPVTGNWQPVAGMSTSMAAYDSAVLHGKFFVTEGWVWPFLFSPRGEVYDPKADAWEPMAAGLREGWTGSSVVIDGHLLVVSEHENMRVKVYDTKSDSWNTVDGSPVPEKICRPFSVNTSDGKIYVVGRSLHIAIGYVRKTGCGNFEEGKKKASFSVQWRVVDAPETLCHLTPSSTEVLFG
ncbi:hypothetical protein Taro_003522, partial [Colocasia esculenta]|nr:hypothetical protein [Colocasia esculenta]